MDDATCNSAEVVKDLRLRKPRAPPILHLLDETREKDKFLELLSTRSNRARVVSDEFIALVKQRESNGTIGPSTIISVGPYSFPPLHWAAILSNSSVVTWLMSRGYSCRDVVPGTGQTSLHTMALFGPLARWQQAPSTAVFMRVVTELVDAMGEQDNNMATPLHLVVSKIYGIDGEKAKKSARTYKELLSCMLKCLLRCANWNEVLGKQDKNGDTVLHLLADDEDVMVPLVKGMKEGGSCLTVRNKNGQTPYDIAIEKGNKHVAYVLNPNRTGSSHSGDEADGEFDSDSQPKRRSSRKRKALTCSSAVESKRLPLKTNSRKSASAGPEKESYDVSDGSNSSDEDAMGSSCDATPMLWRNESSMSVSLLAPQADGSSLLQLLVDGGVWDDLPSIVMKRKLRLEKQLTVCEEELKVSVVAVEEATSVLRETENRILKRTADLCKIQKELQCLAKEREKWEQEVERLKSELLISKLASETRKDGIKQQMLKLECLAKHVQSPKTEK